VKTILEYDCYVPGDTNRISFTSFRRIVMNELIPECDLQTSSGELLDSFASEEDDSVMQMIRAERAGCAEKRKAEVNCIREGDRDHIVEDELVEPGTGIFEEMATAPLERTSIERTKLQLELVDFTRDGFEVTAEDKVEMENQVSAGFDGLAVGAVENENPREATVETQMGDV
jgi:hypothetical protein